MKGRDLVIAAAYAGALGLVAFYSWEYFKRARLKFQIGADAYGDLAALQPQITAPVIRVPVPY